MCHYCSSTSRIIACKYCKKAEYCSTKCGTNHWFESHKNECIGKQTGPEEKRKEMFDKMMDHLTHLPQPTDAQKERAARYALELNNNNIELAAADYARWEQNLSDRHERDIMLRFVDDYFASYGAPEAGVAVLKDHLDEADIILSNSLFDMAEGRTPVISAALDHFEQAARLGVQMTLHKDLPVPSSAKEEQKLISTLKVQYALFLTETFATFSFKTRKSDAETRAYGFEPNPLLEDGDETTIQQRIDEGVLPKPDWWDTRYAPFTREWAAIGGKTQEELAKEFFEEQRRQKAREKEKLERRARLNPADLNPADLIAREPNANVQVQAEQAEILMDNVLQVMPEADDSIIEAIESLLATKNPVGRGLILIGRFLGILLGISGVAKLVSSFTEADFGILSAVDDQIAKFVKMSVDLQSEAKLSEKMFLAQQKALDELNGLIQATSSNATSISVFPTMQYLAQYSENVPGVTQSLDQTRYLLFQKGVSDAAAILRYRIGQELEYPSLSPEQYRDLTTTYEVITNPAMAPHVIVKRFYQYASYTLSSIRAVDLRTPTSKVVEGAFEFAERLIKVVGSQREVLDQGLRLAAKAFRVGEVFITQVKQSVGKLQRYSALYLANTNYFQRMLDGDHNLEPWAETSLHILSGSVSIITTLMAGLTVDPRVSKQFLGMSPELITFMDVWIGDPSLPARLASALTSNPHLFYVIIRMILSIEERGHEWLNPRLRSFEEAKKQNSPGSEKMYIFARYFVRPSLATLASMRHVLSFGALAGLFMLWIQTSYRSGWRFPTIFGTTQKEMAHTVGPWLTQRGWIHKLFTVISIGKMGVTGFFNGYLAYTGLSQCWAPRINVSAIDGTVRSLTLEELEASSIPEHEKRRLQQAGVVARTEAFGRKTKIVAGFSFLMQIASLIIVMTLVYGTDFTMGVFKYFQIGTLINDKPHWTTYKTKRDFALKRK